MSRLSWLLGGVLWLAAAASAQNSLYSTGGCRILGDAPPEPDSLVNVTCACNQFVAQTDQSQPIDVLTVTGCSETSDPSVSPPVSTVGLTQPRRRRLGSRDFVLLNVRSLYLSRGRFRLLREPPRASSHPLMQLHVSQAELVGGLTDSALAGMPYLQHVSFSQVDVPAMHQSCLSRLPQLRSLSFVDSSVVFLNSRVLTGVPRLRQLHLIRNELNFIRSNAFILDAAAEEDVGDAEVCAVPVTEPLTEPHPSAVSVFVAENSIHSMSREAFLFRGFQHVVFSNNTVGEMSQDALVVSVRAPPDCASANNASALFQFSGNVVQDMPEGAVTAESAGPGPAALLLGGNTLLQGALSPRQLRLTGQFQPSQSYADDNPSRYSCVCCNCSDTSALFELALNVSADAVDAVFTDAILSARCAPDSLASSDDSDSFAEFAERCHPGLTASLGGAARDSATTQRPGSAAAALLLAALAAAIAN